MFSNYYFSLLVVLIVILIPYISSECDNYYQSSSISSTKRVFDICYHSEIDSDLVQSSYRYICNDSYHGNDTVNGYTAFREDYNTIDCLGEVNETSIISEPYSIYCGTNCDVLILREYPIINASSCIYNTSIYSQDIQALAMCDDDGIKSDAIFCNKNGNGYFWSNTYYGNNCDNNKLFEAQYQFNGCQGDGQTYIEIIQCDLQSSGITLSKINAFNDDLFVAGFVLLLIVILFIIFILIWYCFWFKKGFKGYFNNHDNNEPITSHQIDQTNTIGHSDHDNITR